MFFNFFFLLFISIHKIDLYIINKTSLSPKCRRLLMTGKATFNSVSYWSRTTFAKLGIDVWAYNYTKVCKMFHANDFWNTTSSWSIKTKYFFSMSWKEKKVKVLKDIILDRFPLLNATQWQSCRCVVLFARYPF